MLRHDQKCHEYTVDQKFIGQERDERSSEEIGLYDLNSLTRLLAERRRAIFKGSIMTVNNNYIEEVHELVRLD